MTLHRAGWIALTAAIAVVTVSCAAADQPSDTDPMPDAASAPDEDEHDHPESDHDADMHDDHADDHDEHAPEPDDDAMRPRTTEETLAAMAAMDPDRLAGLHAHHDHDGENGRVHPNGIDPERIVIPAIGVDADVIDLGLQDDGSMEVPSDFAQTGWFTPGPRPGRVGPAVIAGHVDSRSGPAVFYRLTDLEPGDEIEVHDPDGQVVTFAVRETEQVPKNAFPTEKVYAGTPGPELRLITCGGIFDRSIGHYDDNIIVYAERIDL